MTRRRLTRALKVWVSPAQFAWLATEARRREWSVPHVIRHAIARHPYTPRRRPGLKGGEP